MTLVSNNPREWPHVDTYQVVGYVLVASSTAIIYDWALTFGQEVELVWRQRCSFMTILCLTVRYVGILYSFNNILSSLPGVSLTDTGCTIVFLTQAGTYFITNTMLGIIMIVRLQAMYQRSRRIFIFLVTIFTTITTTCGILAVLTIHRLSWDDLVLSGTHQCVYGVQRYNQLELLIAGVWILRIVWEILVLCLAAWIAVMHFRELRQFSSGHIIGDCFGVLIKTHVLYFAAFAAVSCFSLGCLSPSIIDSSSVGAQTYYGILQVTMFVQLFVLGPRLILSIREYYAELVMAADGGTGMTSMAFEELSHVSTICSV